MPGVTVATVVSEAQGYLNDVSAGTYTGAVILPYIKMAYEHLRNELALNDIPTLNTITSAQTIAALGTALTSVPSDLLVPIRMEERAVGSTELWQEMYQKTWPPNEVQTNRLRWWDWRNEAIEFLGATEQRSVRLYYLADLNPTAITTGSTLTAGNARSYLAARAAALVAMFIMQNTETAQACNGIADEQLRKVIGIAVKERQGLPTRRRPFLGPRMR